MTEVGPGALALGPVDGLSKQGRALRGLVFCLLQACVGQRNAAA